MMKRYKAQGTRHRAQGFTLLEMSIVLAIIAVAVGGGMMIFTSSLQKKQLQDTQVKLQAIQQALYNFRIANNRLPCPADATQSMGVTANNYYGLEAQYPGACYNGTPKANQISSASYTVTATSGSNVLTGIASTAGLAPGFAVYASGVIPAGTYIASVDSASQVTLSQPAIANGTSAIFWQFAEGMVPTNALGLPDDDGIDGWGHRIMYAVDVGFTRTNTLTPYPSAITMTGNTTNGSQSVSGMASTTGLSAGMFVYGSGIPSGDTIANVVSSTSVTLATAATSLLAPDTLTFSSTMIPNFVILPTDTSQRMTVQDQANNNKTNQAAYVLLSYGPNGHGAYPRNGGTTRISSGSNELNEQKNCDCNSATPPAAQGTGGIYSAFVQAQPYQDSGHIGDPTYSFDDIVVYGTRSSLRGPTE